MDLKKSRQFLVRRVAPVSGLVGLGVLLANLGVVGVFVERGYHYLANTPNTGSFQVNVFDGKRQQIPAGTQVLLTVTDGNQKELIRKYVAGGNIRVNDLPFYDNFGDNYSVIVWAKGFSQAGFHPVKLERGKVKNVDLMLVPSPYQFDFANAQWDALKQNRPALWSVIAAGLPDAEAKARWEKLLKDQPSVAAHLLNEMTAVDGWRTSKGASFLPYFQELIWDGTMNKGDFWGWADASIVGELRLAVQNKTFEYAAGSQVFHPGNTASFKELSFWEANVQLTFYENDRRTINGVDCVKFETDIDYYRDTAAHVILEVLVNTIGGRMTDPVQAYQLRWIASRQAGKVFDPPYVIVPRP